LIGELVVEFSTKEVRLGSCGSGETSEIPFQIGVSDISESYIYWCRRIYLINEADFGFDLDGDWSADGRTREVMNF